MIMKPVNKMNTLRDTSGERLTTAFTKTDGVTCKLDEGLCLRCP